MIQFQEFVDNTSGVVGSSKDFILTPHIVTSQVIQNQWSFINYYNSDIDDILALCAHHSEYFYCINLLEVRFA
jgi:hypothetical protein